VRECFTNHRRVRFVLNYVHVCDQIVCDRGT
jgi:hypothetical protein